MTPPEDTYTHGHAEAVLRSHRWRTAENSAAYLLPHVQPNARLLDVGCGPGTITVDLARLAPDGIVVGIDRSEGVLAEARAAAAAAGVTNLEIAVGDVYSLGYGDDSFDVVHAHQVLQHLSDPVAALREMGRVCRPDGVVAVRDSDYSAFTWWPALPELDEWLRVYQAVARGTTRSRTPAPAQELGPRGRARVVAATARCGVSRHDDVAWWGGLGADLDSDLARRPWTAGSRATLTCNGSARGGAGRRR